MAKVNISNVVVLDNPSPFQNPFQFEITFECLEDLPEGMFNTPTNKRDFFLDSFVSVSHDTVDQALV